MSVWLTKLIWQDGLAILGRGQYLRNKRLLGKHSNPSVIENYLLYSLHGEILVKASMFVNSRRPVATDGVQGFPRGCVLPYYGTT